MRTESKRRRTTTTLVDKIINQPSRKRNLLIRLLRELTLINGPPLRFPKVCNAFRLMGERRLFPLTNAEILLEQLIASRDWRRVMANEVLRTLELLHRAGYPEAVPSALRWCRRFRFHIPDWALAALCSDVTPKAKRQGKRPLDSIWEQFRKDCIRTLAVMESDEVIATERESPGYHRATIDRANDRFWRAKQLVAGPWKSLGADTSSEFSTEGIRKSYKKIIERNYRLYVDTARLMDIFRFQFPTLYKLLS